VTRLTELGCSGAEVGMGVYQKLEGSKTSSVSNDPENTGLQNTVISKNNIFFIKKAPTITEKVIYILSISHNGSYGQLQSTLDFDNQSKIPLLMKMVSFISYLFIG